jgi:hypothetical protein
MGSRSSWAAALVLVLAACGTPAPKGPTFDVADLTEAHPCGHGFAVGTPEQDVAFLLYLWSGDFEADVAGDFDRTVELPTAHWDAEVQVGERLFGNWCNDVTAPPEVEPVVAETWRVTGGLLTLEEGTPPRCDGGSFTATLEGLEVTPPDGEPTVVGDLELRNDGWGCFAG